jgi:hypothetical protein
MEGLALTGLHAIRQAVLFSGICLLTAAPTLDSSERLAMKVSPLVAFAPGFLTVSVTVPADDENRLLQVVAESADFYRSSQVSLDGKNAAPLNVFKFSDLPSGSYEITSVLIGANGRRAIAQRIAKVQPSVGSR